jgi:uncharacterized protein (DUF302 family)
MSAFRLAALAVAALQIGAARAHHSFAPVYDSTRTIDVSGTVTAFRLVNPHAMFALDVAGDAGETVQWTVELDGRTNLSSYGWNDATIVVGERIRVTGNPTHTGSPRMWFLSLQRADGSVLRRPIAERILGTLEEERKQLVEQRRQAPQPESSPQAEDPPGLVTVQSKYSVADTVKRFEDAVTAAGWMVFARLDHAAAAEKYEQKLLPRTVVVYGNPATGTANMVTAPTLAIDIPPRALVWQDEQGKVWLSYNSATYLVGTIYARHGVMPLAPQRVQAYAEFLEETVRRATR